MVDPLPFFSSGLGFLYSFADGGDEAWIVRAENFNDRIAGAQLLNAVRDRVPPGGLIPGNFQRGIAVSIVGNVNAGSDTRNSFDEFRNAIHARVPFVVEFFRIDFQPGLNGGQSADHFFLADFHRTADGPFPGSGVAHGGFDQIFSS